MQTPAMQTLTVHSPVPYPRVLRARQTIGTIPLMSCLGTTMIGGGLPGLWMAWRSDGSGSVPGESSRSHTTFWRRRGRERTLPSSENLLSKVIWATGSHNEQPHDMQHHMHFS